MERETSQESQIMWCCQHRRAGCGAKHQFDCFAGYDNWKEGWSSTKMVYCCDQFGMGCERDGDHYEHLEELHISSSDDYDCTAGYDNWQKGWSQDKQSFCCGKYKLGCPKGWSQHQVHFGHHWSSDWSRLGHHVWATHKSHHSHHHGPIKYDCVTDYEHWQVSWSSKRAKFCCWAASWCLLRTGCDLCAGNSIERKQNLHSCSMSIWTVVHAFPQLIDWRVWEIWWTAFILFRCWVQSWKNVKPELLWFLCLLNFLEKVARTWQRELQVNNTWAQSTKCLETDIEARSKN